MQPANRITIILIISSLVLLLLLQAFWLQRAYRDERSSMERDARMVLRNTLFEMNDSLIQRRIQAIDTLPDSNAWIDMGLAPGKNARTNHYFQVDSPVAGRTHREFSKMTFRDSTANVQVFVYSQNGRDTIKNLLKPIISRIGTGSGPQSFSIRLRNDSLRARDVEQTFRKALARSGVQVPTSAVHIRRDVPAIGHDFRSEPGIFTPSGAFRLDFDRLHWITLRNISPQILFSIFLTLLTTASFIILYRSVRSQQRLMKLKNDFISNMTHELKTPVTTVGVALEALQNFKGLDNPQLTREYLDIAQNELNRLTVLTDTILKTAIFESNGVAFVPEPVAFDDLIDQVIGSMKLVLDKKNAHVEFRKEGRHFMLQGGSAHLTSVIFNLLDNALKYSHDSPSILIQLKDSNETLILTVQDNGVGIPPEYRKKIFEKFFRVPTGDIHNIKGYGLGLSYVESVVKEHGGTIELESELGKGSTFRIVLPKQN